MLSELLLLRAASPKAFRGLRWAAALLFWMLIFLFGIGLLIEIGSSPAHHRLHHHNNGHEVR
jgi:hypothetical protein